MEFRVLGPLEVLRDGSIVELPGGKPRAVLAFLLLHANEPVSAERLAAALWGEDATAGTARTVQVYVSRLRRALDEDDLLTTSRAGYRLRVGRGELDAERFERLVADGRRALAEGRPQDAGERLREALGLWRGSALADLALEPFGQTEIARLEEQRLAAVEARVEADLAADKSTELVPELQHLVGEHPLRERLHGQLMVALYRSGRQADALSAYRHARELLVEELGIEPTDELRELEQAILTHDPALLLAGAQTGTVGGAPRGEATGAGQVRVPLPPTQTVGRDAAIASLRAAVASRDGRLVTVVGAGGAGKTRVAIELARAVGPGLRDGAVFVSLAPLTSPEHVASAIARELDVTPAASESLRDALAHHVAQRELLLVLDNFEHVLEAAPLVAELLATAPQLTVVATSREPLHLRAERLFQLEPLAITPERDALEPAPAVALFISAVEARHPAFTLNEDEQATIAEVCRLLDGLPLAIELAASGIGLCPYASWQSGCAPALTRSTPPRATPRSGSARSRPRWSGATRCSTWTSRMSSTR